MIGIANQCKVSFPSVKWVKSLIRVRLFATPWTVAHQAPPPWDSPSKNTGVGCHFLLQGSFLTQGSNPCLLHWQEGSLLLCHFGLKNGFKKSKKMNSFNNHIWGKWLFFHQAVECLLSPFSLIYLEAILNHLTESHHVPSQNMTISKSISDSKKDFYPSSGYPC